MSGVKHTPSWRWERTGCRVYEDAFYRGRPIKVAEVSVAHLDEDALNFRGRLIAAAPDHHAVALELDRLALVIDSAVRFADPAFKDEVQALLRANKAAIARARGEQDGGAS